MNKGEIILYQPDNSIQLEVRIEEDTVWLTQQQMSLLFGVNRTVIVKHIKNIYRTMELNEISTCAKNAQVQQEGGRQVMREVNYYNFDMIISVGFRANSINATKFRQWANNVLREHLLHGYTVNQRLLQLEHKVAEHDKQIEFFVRTSLPPVEGIFYDGQIFDSYTFATNLIKSAKTRIILIDNYIDESVLLMLSKRQDGVSALIMTRKITNTLKLDLARHQQQYSPIDVQVSPIFHDRFLVIDGIVYHIGASLKDLGKKLFAFSKLEVPVEKLGIV